MSETAAGSCTTSTDPAAPELAPRVGMVYVLSSDPEKAWKRWAKDTIMLVDIWSSFVMS
jgi:hypothetical protein